MTIKAESPQTSIVLGLCRNAPFGVLVISVIFYMCAIIYLRGFVAVFGLGPEHFDFSVLRLASFAYRALGMSLVMVIVYVGLVLTNERGHKAFWVWYSIWAILYGGIATLYLVALWQERPVRMSAIVECVIAVIWITFPIGWYGDRKRSAAMTPATGTWVVVVRRWLAAHPRVGEACTMVLLLGVITHICYRLGYARAADQVRAIESIERTVERLDRQITDWRDTNEVPPKGGDAIGQFEVLLTDGEALLARVRDREGARFVYIAYSGSPPQNLRVAELLWLRGRDWVHREKSAAPKSAEGGSGAESGDK